MPRRTDLLDRLEGLMEDEDREIDSGLADLMREVINKLPSNTVTPPGMAPPKLHNTVLLTAYPAANSRPLLDEAGINDYDRGQDTRRYGFDMGFMSKLLRDTFTIEKGGTVRDQSILNFLKQIGSKISKKLLFQQEPILQKRHFQLYPLAHRLDRIEKCGKYIEAWVVAVAKDPAGDREEYTDMRTVIPKSWLHDAECEVLARRNPTQDRNTFKKEVAAKLKFNYDGLKESEGAHLVSLGA